MFRCVQILQTKMFVQSIALFEQTPKINIWSSMRKFFLNFLILLEGQEAHFETQISCLITSLVCSFKCVLFSRFIASEFQGNVKRYPFHIYQLLHSSGQAHHTTTHWKKITLSTFLTWSGNMTIPLPPLCNFAVRSGQVWLDSAKEICHTNVTNCR